MNKENSSNGLTAPTLVPSLKATLLDIPKGSTHTFSCDIFSYVYIQTEATRLTKMYDKKKRRGRMFSVTTSDKGRTATVTRNW